MRRDGLPHLGYLQNRRAHPMIIPAICILGVAALYLVWRRRQQHERRYHRILWRLVLHTHPRHPTRMYYEADEWADLQRRARAEMNSR